MKSTQKGLTTFSKDYKNKYFWLKKKQKLSSSSIFLRNNVEYKFQCTDYEIPQEIISFVSDLTKGSKFLEYIVYLSSIYFVLSRFFKSSNVHVFSPIYNNVLESDNIQGLIPLIYHFRDELTFKNIVQDIRRNIIESYEYSDFLNSGDVIVNDILKTSNLSLIFLYGQEYNINNEDIWTISFKKKGEKKFFVNNYNKNVVDKNYIDNFLDGCINYLFQAKYFQKKRVSEYSLVNYKDFCQKYYSNIQLNKSKFTYQKSYFDLVKEVVNKFPDDNAISDDNVTLSFKKSFIYANRIAAYLQNKGIAKEKVVGLLSYRNVDFLLHGIGILFTGAVYLPLNPEHPERRIAEVIKSSKAKMLLYHPSFVGKINGLKKLLDADISICKFDDTCNHQLDFIPQKSIGEQLAYMIFTSGTTGKPKGVMIQKDSFFNTLFIKEKDFKISHKKVVLQSASQCFDISVWQMFAPIISGAMVYIASDRVVKDPKTLIDCIYNKKINIIEVVPSLLETIIKEIEMDYSIRKLLNSLEILICTGEIVSPAILKRWYNIFPNIEVKNAYGPAECSDDVTHFLYTKQFLEEKKFLPVGKILPGYSVYILDENLNLLPNGIKGEIYIGGLGVGRGYVGESALTAQKFIPDHLSKKSGHRMYATGDIGMYHSNGFIYCFGRDDTQVKLRGFRIELDEISSVINSHPDVRKAATILYKNKVNQISSIVSFIVTSDQNSNITEELNQYISKHIPGYMLPKDYCYLKELPVTSNGKVDRFKLLELYEKQKENSFTDLEAQNNLPITKNEKMIAMLWEKFLGIKRVKRSDDFFRLGGDSITNIQISQEARKNDLHLRARDVYDNSILKHLAKNTFFISKGAQQLEKNSIKSSMLTPVQKWFFEQKFNEQNHWNQSLFFEISSDMKIELLEKSLKIIVQQHDALRTVFVLDKYDNIHQKVVNNNSYRFNIIKKSNRKWENIAYQAQKLIDIKKGPLFVIFLIKESDKSYIYYVAHHLVIDRISWSILLEDLEYVYLQLMKDETLQDVALPYKSISFLQWSKALYKYSKNNDILSKCIKGESGKFNFKSLSKGNINKRKKAKISVYSDYINQSITKEIHALIYTYDVQLQVLLVSALIDALSELTHSEYIEIELEHHGRYEISHDLDISRTIGWFTTFGAFGVSVDSLNTIQDKLKIIACKLNNWPEEVFHSCIKKYLLSKKEFIKYDKPDISFNFLGNLDPENNNMKFFKRLPEIGHNRSEITKPSFAIDINCAILNSKLEIRIEYDQNVYHLNTIKNLSKKFKHIIDLYIKQTDILHKNLDINSTLVQLTPTQQWFFDNKHINYQWWNNAILISLPKIKDKMFLFQLQEHLVEVFDVFTLRFDSITNQQIYNKNQSNLQPHFLEVSLENREEFLDYIDKYAENLNTSIDIYNGVLGHIVLVNNVKCQISAILLILHHTIVDPHSWQLLLDEIKCFDHHQKKISANKTTTFSEWSNALKRLSQIKISNSIIDYWASNDLCNTTNKIFDKINLNNNIEKYTTALETCIDYNVTCNLYNKCAKNLSVSFFTLLIFSLQETIFNFFDTKSILIELGGHGREEFFKTLNLSGTVGWFTTSFPFILTNSLDKKQISLKVKNLNKGLKVAIDNSFYYNFLKYTYNDLDVREKVSRIPTPMIRFDYDGILNLFSEDNNYTITTQHTGMWKDPETRRFQLIDIITWISDGRLHIKWQFSCKIFKIDEIKKMSAKFNEVLQLLSVLE